MEKNGQSNAEAIIRVDNLTKIFDDKRVVDEISFEIPKGSIFGFIGPSGCGKTTTVRLLTGIYKASSGKAEVMGSSPQSFRRGVREKIGYMPQHFALYPDLSVRENLNFSASMYGVKFLRKELLEEVLNFVELSEHGHKLVRNISGGMQRRLSLAATLVHKPSLLFLDEPTGGIDPVLRRKLWDYFNELREDGKTLFVTTQYVSEAAYCDLVGVMMDGKVLLVDTPKGLRQKAMGGEVVVMRTTVEIPPEKLKNLRDQDFISGKVERSGENRVNLSVEAADRAIPKLVAWGNQQNIQLESIQEYLPPFDDVFVKLIRSHVRNE